MARELSELVDEWMDQEKLYRVEGRRGVETLCQLAAVLGYKDPMYFGQITSKATIGDLICMLEDNSGLIEAMIDWVKETDSPEWRESLQAEVIVPGSVADQYEDGVCPDCNEEINPDAVIGDACDNCGHVFNPVADNDDGQYQPTDADFRCTEG